MKTICTVLLTLTLIGCYQYPHPQASYPHTVAKTVALKNETSGVVDGHSQAYYHIYAQDKSRCDVDPQDYESAQVGHQFSCGHWHTRFIDRIDIEMPTER